MIIADTGFWLALACRRDPWHKRSKEVLSTLEEQLTTTWPVLTETCHLLSSRVGQFSVIHFMREISDGKCDLFVLSRKHASRCLSLMTKYRDLPMDLADASLVILAEELGDGRILSTDERDFRSYRWKNHKPFKNLLSNSGDEG